MMQHKFSDLTGFVSIKGILQLEKIAQEEANRRHCIEMAGRRIASEKPDQLAWLCLRVLDGREVSVEKSMSNEDIEALVPTRKGPELRRRGRVIPPADIPVLLGYVLVRCIPSAHALLALKSFEYVSGIVGSWIAPQPIPDDFVSRFKAKAEAGEYDWERPASLFRRGQIVEIDDGPFKGFRGPIVSCRSDGIGNAVVELGLFGSLTPVNIPLAMLVIP